MKWSTKDVARFAESHKTEKQFKVVSVEENILVYSYADPTGYMWTFRAKLLRGGKNLAWKLYFTDDDTDLFESRLDNLDPPLM